MASSTNSTPSRLANAWRDRAVSLKATVFALVGLVNTVIDYAVFLAARAVLSRSPAVLALTEGTAERCHCAAPGTLLLVMANTISWFVAVNGSYVMNSSFTFAPESGRKLAWRPYASFVVAGIAGLLANTALLVFAAQVLTLPIWLAKALAVLASFLVNFSLAHFFIFRAPGAAAPKAGEGG